MLDGTKTGGMDTEYEHHESLWWLCEATTIRKEH